MFDSVTPWTVCSPPVFSLHGIYQARILSGLPSPEDLCDPGFEPVSPGLASGFFTNVPPGKLNSS